MIGPLFIWFVSLKKIRDAANSLDSWGIHAHVSEDIADEADAAQKGYGSVLERLEEFDLINDKYFRKNYTKCPRAVLHPVPG